MVLVDPPSFPHACRGGWFAVTAVCPFGPSGPSGPSCKVVRDQTCASALIVHRVSARSFGDKPCVAHSHSRMRAVAVGLLLLRHVHFVHQVHQVHFAKCFVTKTCASALIAPQLLSAEHCAKLDPYSGNACLFCDIYNKKNCIFQKKYYIT